MDEAAGVAIKEDGAENEPFNGDRASENSIGSPAEDTEDMHRAFIHSPPSQRFASLRQDRLDERRPARPS